MRAGPPGPREAKWRGREPRAGQGPGGGAARIRGGAKTTAATVVEGDRGSAPGPLRSGVKARFADIPTKTKSSD
jgi:hypothetical protein